MTHPLDEVINSMCNGYLQRRPREELSLEIARFNVEKMREQGDYNIVIVWGKHA